MARFAETHEVVVDFLRGIDRQRIAGGIVLQTADENTDHFTFEIEQRRARFAALRRKIHAQMRRGKISAEILPIETGDHSEAGRLWKIERKTDRNDRRRNFQLIRMTNWQRRRSRVHFEHCQSTAQIDEDLTRG